MTDNQKYAAMALLKSGLSTKGAEQASAIMNLEAILADLEQGGISRDPKLYFVSIFGEPSATGPWSWRFEGHHLSVNVTLNKGEVVSTTPLVFGANPAEIKDGPRKGTRTLPEIEDLAKDLIASLDEAQIKMAKHVKQFPEIRENTPQIMEAPPAGIAAAKLNDSQQKKLRKLIETYATRLPADIAAIEMNALTKTSRRCISAISWTKPSPASRLPTASKARPSSSNSSTCNPTAPVIPPTTFTAAGDGCPRILKSNSQHNDG